MPCRIKPHEPYWFNKAAKKACSRQSNLYSKHKRTGNIQFLTSYKKLRKANKNLFKAERLHGKLPV